MRGSPLISVLVLAVALVLAGVPVWSLTRPEPPAPATTAATKEAGNRPVEFSAISTTGAVIELRAAGAVIWKSPAPGENFAQDLQIPDGTQIVAHVRWVEAGKQNATRLRFSRDGDLLAEASLWGEQEAEEVVTLTPATP